MQVGLNVMNQIIKTKNWKTLIEILDEGYKGMFVILRILYESDKEVCAGDLATQMGVSTARIARALNTLESKGYVARKQQQSDARKVTVVLTEQGKLVLLKRKAEIESVVSPMFANLTDEERTQLLFLLKKLLS